MLVSMKKVLDAANSGHYAVGSFNVANLEMMETVIRVAAQCQSPVIVSTSSAEARYLGPAVAYSMANALAQKYNTPLVLHLDHGDSFEMAMQCIRAGYTSVMFDGSHHPLDENIEMSKEVVQAAHAVGVSVEGEVGRIQGVEDDLTVSEHEAALSDVGEAMRFAKETGVDALAVAIGNAHGFYKRSPQLDFERLRAIREATGIPIVLHGGTGIPAEQIRQAIGLGIAKINIASKVNYPTGKDADQLSHALKTLATMVKLDVGLRIGQVDFDGWDTHEDQYSQFPPRVEALSKALAAFYHDLEAYHDRLTILVMSEFGRRLRTNKSGGTDHGYGNMMMVLGKQVKGGRMYGKWPGLNQGELAKGVDLDITTDYRAVLGEILQGRLDLKDVGRVFPGFAMPKPLGFLG